ncbi:hypothetical protein DFH11DRAFT_1883415 [Phellopilus nigrolimitatus]|nr:hypothetical protein DFH11DRAFT_1883415 [Phellopilus nigrolimitatus]
MTQDMRHPPSVGTYDADIPACSQLAGSYVGVLGAKIRDPAFGGDIGFELSCTFAAIVYPIARYIERKLESHAGMRTAAEGATEHAAVAKHRAFLRSLTFNSTFRFHPLSNFVKSLGAW